MANQRISQDKRALVIAGLVEGLPIRAVCRACRVGKNGVKRIIAETGEALADYMMRTFTGLQSERLEIDEQWQYVGQHGQRMRTKQAGEGDFWVWCALDPDSKLVVTYRVGTRRSYMAEELIADLAKRVPGCVQITTDKNPNYLGPIRAYFGERANYAVETKVFHDPREWDPAAWPQKRKNGVPKIAKATRESMLGEPDLGTSTTAHVKRVFLSIRQELARF